MGTWRNIWPGGRWWVALAAAMGAMGVGVGQLFACKSSRYPGRRLASSPPRLRLLASSPSALHPPQQRHPPVTPLSSS